MTGFKQESRALIKAGEGCVQHMYLDGEGNVTIGVGNLLADPAAAQALPFIVIESGNSATAAQISQEFATVASKEPGRAATYYAQFCSLELTDSEIDQLLDTRIDAFESDLRKDFPDFDNYPEPAKLGLIDMVFNLGNYGLLNKFPKFTQAARDQNWEECASQCHRKQVQESRNEEVEQLFLECEK